jgi:hypothetical protein
MIIGILILCNSVSIVKKYFLQLSSSEIVESLLFLLSSEANKEKRDIPLKLMSRSKVSPRQQRKRRKKDAADKYVLHQAKE